MRCALYQKNNMTRSRQSNKAKPVSVTRVSSATTSDNVTVVLESTARQSTRQREMTNKPARTEVVKSSGQRTSGGRHLQPPTGNNAKLKHECPFEGCPWRFATPYKLRRHIKSHTKETPYQCKECGRGFSVRYNLLMHIQTIHSTPHKYKCPIAGCKEAFHTQPRLNGHLRKIHKKDWKQLQLEQEKSGPTKKATDTDSIAGSPSSSDSSSMKDTPIDPSSSKWHKCIDCGKEFSSQAKLSTHMKAHTGSYPCTVQGCSKLFPSVDKLSKHLDSFHRSFPCPNKDCNRVFLKQSQLKNHIRVHNNVKYSCPKPDCGSKFDNEVDYNDHLHIHMGYSIPCPYKHCNLSFPTQKRLELHYRVAHQNNTTTSSSTGVTLSQFLQSNNKEESSSSKDHATVSDSDNFMDGLELPDLKVEDVEAVISEHTSWTGDQIETFLKSLDFEELDCRGSLKSSLSGYESDSGYSTHEVSPMGGCSTQYNSALSPAITPVTPSPILSSSSSTSSPVPFCLYQDDLFATSNPYMTPATPNSVTPSSDHHFFSGTDLPLFSQASPNALTEHVFQTPTLCHSNSSHHVPTCNTFHSIPSSQSFITLSQPPKSCVQSVLPPTNNVSDIETNRHSVTIVPNSYCITSCSTDLSSSSVAMSHASTSQCNDSSFAQFDKFLDGYLLSSEDGQVSRTTSPSLNLGTVKMENDCVVSKDVVDRLHAKLRQPEEEDAKHCLLSEIKDISPIMKQKGDGSSKSTTDGISLLIDGCSLSPETSRMVIAQVLSSPKKAQSMMGSFSASQATSGRPCKGKGKGRQQTTATLSMKGVQRGKRKSNWPKSMNSGNLMAFRNFILGKLKQSKPISHSFARPCERLISCEMPTAISAPPTCSSSFFSTPTDDIFNEITFNPDTLLSSERSLSPFSHHSHSISPSPVPLSPSLESNMHFTSLSSLSSDPGVCTANLGIDGFIHCLSVDPMSQSLGTILPDQLCCVQMPGEFSSILKTDADPLLGGIS